ncbi:O-antigen ligase family protein, partial [Patescibacteria group bacterium]|nr:O-antigen ligase family protein [Patescibacteria group bacterium]
KITYLFIAYFIAITASTLNSILIFQNNSLSILLLNTLRRFEYISIFFITLSAIKNKKDYLFAYLSLLLALCGIAVYGYGQKYFQFPVVSTMNEEFSKGQLLQMNVWTRISSTFAGHYDLAAYLSLVLIIVVSVAIITKNKFLKLSSFILFLIGFHLLTLTASRVSVFAFWGAATLCLLLLRRFFWVIPVSAIVVFSFFNSKDLNQRLIATIPTLKLPQNSQKISPTPSPVESSSPTPIIAIVSPVIKKTTPTPTVFRHPAVEEVITADVDSGVARSGEIRFNVEWPRAIAAFQKNPVSGTGLGSITLATDNDYLRALGESGLIGFISFTVIFVFLFIHTLPYLRKKPDTLEKQIPIILFSVMLSTLANATFIDVFEASKVAYTIWIIMAFYYQSLSIKK